jgi:hypothetical protein
LFAILALATTSLSLLVSPASPVAASPRTAPPVGTLINELKGSGAVAGDAVGVSVAISGSTAVVGAPGYAKDVGWVYVFTHSSAGWKQSAELKGSGTVGGDFFGYSVALSGNTAVVGAPGYAKNTGRAFWFTDTAAGWKQIAELKGSDTVASDYFGESVSISGTTALVGGDGHKKSAGRAYVFTDTSTGWRQTAELKGSNTVANNGFGVSVAISGATAVAGAPGFSKAAGRVYVFGYSGGQWKQSGELKGSDTVSNDDFGYTVAVSGTTAVAGAPGDAKDAGRAYLFTHADTRWNQAAELKGSDTVAGDYFGYSVALSGTTAITGADGHSKSTGRAYVFEA